MNLLLMSHSTKVKEFELVLVFFLQKNNTTNLDFFSFNFNSGQ